MEIRKEPDNIFVEFEVDGRQFFFDIDIENNRIEAKYFVACDDGWDLVRLYDVTNPIITGKAAEKFWENLNKPPSPKTIERNKRSLEVFRNTKRIDHQ